MECRRGLAMRILSVRLSVWQTRGLWQNGRKIGIDFTPYEKPFSLVFWEEEWLVEGDPFYLKFWVNRPPLGRNRRFWTDIRSYSASAATPSEKSAINTNRKSTTRFPMSLRWSSYVVLNTPSSSKGAQKRKVSRIWTITAITQKRYEIVMSVTINH